MSKGKYVYMSPYGSDVDATTHSVRAGVLRTYAKRSLKLIDGPDTAKIVAASTKRDGTRQGVWFPVQKDKDQCYKTGRDAYYMKEYGWCDTTHLIPPEEIRRFCVEELGMTEEQPTVIEVERIVEIEKIVETPLHLSFEERDILATALRREQHVVNDMIRQAYESDDEHRASLLVGRLDELLSLMERLGIRPDDWANGPVWMAGVDFNKRSEEEPEPQITMFGKEGTECPAT